MKNSTQAKVCSFIFLFVVVAVAVVFYLSANGNPSYTLPPVVLYDAQLGNEANSTLLISFISKSEDLKIYRVSLGNETFKIETKNPIANTTGIWSVIYNVYTVDVAVGDNFLDYLENFRVYSTHTNSSFIRVPIAFETNLYAYAQMIPIPYHFRPSF